MANQNTADIGFKKQIWDAACVLRGNLDASEYKQVVLGLIFLKYISDKFDERYQQLLTEGEGFEEDIDEYIAEGVFFVPSTARWSIIAENAHTPEIGTIIDNAMRAIEKENKRLKDILPKNFARNELDKRRLGDVVDLFTNIQMIEHGDSKDILGQTYEYCLSKFAEQEGKLAGEFYTPACVVNTLVEVLKPFNGRVYDPCCGSGGMFVQSAEFIKNHQGSINNIAIYGQDSNPTTWKLCMMNLAIRGIEADLGGYRADTFFDDRHKTLKADYILANPPFNLSDWGASRLQDDVRWSYGIPPESNANFAWLQHMIHHLAPNGRMGMVLANTALSVTTGTEYEIRKAIIEDDLIECIVSLPAQLFFTTKIKVSLWFINKAKKQPGKVLFINARKLGSMVSRTLKEFTNDDIIKIASTVEAFQNGSELTQDESFCYITDIDEIRKRNYNISPSKYISGSIDATEVPDYEEVFAEHINRISHSRDLCASLESKIAEFETRPAGEVNNHVFDLVSQLHLPNIYSLNDQKSTTLLRLVDEKSSVQNSIEEEIIMLSESLFKYWFIDFNFPNKQDLPYLECGGELKKSKYGEIPLEWNAIPFGQILRSRSDRVGDLAYIGEYSTTNRGIQPRGEKFSRSITANSNKNKIVERGDLVFGMSREILNFGVMKDEIGGVSPAYHVYRIDSSQINPEFLEIYMRICDDYFHSLIKPGAREGQVLDKDEVQTMQILLPPLDIQNKYMLVRKYFTKLLSGEFKK